VGGIRWRDAIILGIAQGLAITPGISRSGTTITVALLLGIEREAAARFSFLMSVPAILGAVTLKASEASFSGMDPAQLGVGAIAAMISGYFALIMLVHVVKNGTFQHFAWYCFAAAAIAGYISIS
jgi:undecaprenyl-diphosphatase